MADNISNVGLPNSSPTAYPTIGGNMAGNNVPTPLVGPGNLPNPPVGIGDFHGLLPDPMTIAPLPYGNAVMTPQTMGIPGASASPVGMVIQPGSDVRMPLVPGVRPAEMPDLVPGDNYGLGTK